jgi:hypothetical protein
MLEYHIKCHTIIIIKMSYIRKSFLGDRDLDYLIATINNNHMVKLVCTDDNELLEGENIVLSKWFKKNNNISDEFDIVLHFDNTDVFRIEQLIISNISYFYERCKNKLFKINYFRDELLLIDENGVKIHTEPIERKIIEKMRNERIRYALVENLNHTGDILDVKRIEYFRSDKVHTGDIKDSKLIRKPCLIMSKDNIYRNFIIEGSKVFVVKNSDPYNSQATVHTKDVPQNIVKIRIKNISADSLRKYEEIEINGNGYCTDKDIVIVEKTVPYNRNEYEMGDRMKNIFDLNFVRNAELTNLYYMYNSYIGLDSTGKRNMFNDNQVYINIFDNNRTNEMLYKIRKIMPEININIVSPNSEEFMITRNTLMCE